VTLPAAVARGRDAVASLAGLLRGTLTVGIVRAPVDRAEGDLRSLDDFQRTSGREIRIAILERM
jgi:hypothetical protein